MKMNKEQIAFPVIYGTMIKQAQILLNSSEFAEKFKNKSKEERIAIKKKILEVLKEKARSVANKLKKEGLLNSNILEIERDKLKEIIKSVL